MENLVGIGVESGEVSLGFGVESVEVSLGFGGHCLVMVGVEVVKC